MRRGSIGAGTFEETFFAKPAKGECGRLIRMARVALDIGRRVKREARGEGRDLTGPEKLRARLNGGKVYPSYDRLAPVTALGRATVACALQILEDAGFLIRQRRFRRVEGEGPGPRFEQTSNAYRPIAPKKLLSLLPRWLRPAPVPDDALQHVADQTEEQEQLKAQLSRRELGQLTAGGALGRVLARLGAAIDELAPMRESHEHTEPLLSSFN